MTGLPRRLRPSPEQRAATQLLQTRGAASAAGSTSAARPVTAQRKNRQYVPPAPTVDKLSRLAVGYRLSTTGLDTTDKIYVSSWSFTEETSGSDIIADSDGIGLYAAGVYAVHLFVHGEGMQNADPGCSVLGFCDYFQPFSESFACATRGGDGSSGLLFPSTSRTYYYPGGGAGALQPGLAWTNLDTSVVSTLLLEVQVQRIA